VQWVRRGERNKSIGLGGIYRKRKQREIQRVDVGVGAIGHCGWVQVQT